MTDKLALFEDHIVRAIEHEGELWFPLEDLAAAWGIDRKTPGNLIGRNQDLFAGMFRSDGDVTYHDVNERGLYVLMGKISADRLKNPEAKAAMIRFQRWVPELIQKYRKKEITPTESKPFIYEEIDRARLLAQVTGGDIREFQKIALKKCGYGDYAPALDAVPPLIHGETGQWMNPTDIGQECGLNAREVNSWLYNHDFQYPQGTLWRLTAKGEAYGEEVHFLDHQPPPGGQDTVAQVGACCIRIEEAGTGWPAGASREGMIMGCDKIRSYFQHTENFSENFCKHERTGPPIIDDETGMFLACQCRFQGPGDFGGCRHPVFVALWEQNAGKKAPWIREL